ncbi:MAG: tetratricopeptide repeat protein [Elusimicrobiota bacterium]|jgi:tetratricopeptide (TPR) repeat protein|nr:tetratricopeptide repeat protein [Elusimicrobiota bacterium]
MKKQIFLSDMFFKIILTLAVASVVGYFLYERLSVEQKGNTAAATAANADWQPQTTESNFKQQKQQQEALKNLDKAIKTSPQNSFAYLEKAALLMQAGKHKEALENYNKAISLDANNAGAYVNRAKASFMLGDFSGADKDLTRAIALNPQLAEAYYNRGVANLNMSKMQNAASDFARAQNLFARSKDKKNADDAAKAFRTVDDYIKSSKAAPATSQEQRQSLGKDPKKGATVKESPFLKGDTGTKYDTLKKQDDIFPSEQKSALLSELSSDNLKKRLEEFKANAYPKGVSGEAMPDFASSAAKIAQAVKEKQKQILPKTSIDYRVDAQDNMKKGDYKAAIESLDKAIALNPENADLYEERARANAATSNPQAAIADYTKALNINPKSGSALYNRAEQLSIMGDTKGALQDAASATQQFQADGNKQGELQAENLSNTLQGKLVKKEVTDTAAELLLKEGANAFASGDYNTAKEKFDALLKDYPRPELFYNRAITNAALGNTDAALKDYNAAINGNPNMVDAYIGAAGILTDQDKTEDARANLEKALNLSPDTPGPYKGLAAADIKDGNYENALKNIDKAIALDQQDPAPFFQRGMLYAQKEDLNKANSENISTYVDNYENALQDLTKSKQLAQIQGNIKLLNEITEMEKPLGDILKSLKDFKKQVGGQ